ncbi:MAG TPA: T9SS type A sorting domain-containing protein, partial [Bacteroidia bacterium]|nr:T9SS type A sorting domain-containing protein [Bacteroidia bacterium]
RPGDLVSDSVGNVFMTGGFDLAYPIVFPPETLYAPSGSCSFQCDPMFLVQFNSNGTCLSSLALQSGGDDICAIAEDRSGALYVTGDFMSTSFSLGPFNFPLQNNNSAFTHEEFFIAKLIPEISAGNESPLQHSLFTVFPNPSAGKFEFRSGENITGVMMITDIRGRIISEEKVNSNDLMIDLSGSDPGVYFYKIIFDNGEFLTGKLLRE